MLSKRSPETDGQLDAVIRAIMTHAFVETDKLCVEEGVMAGCTGVTALVVGGRIFCANLGDSRGVLCTCDQDGEVRATALSEDQKPYNPEEQARIEKLGGFVRNKRVLGQLAVSRAFGDVGFKKTSAQQLAESKAEAKGEEKGGDAGGKGTSECKEEGIFSIAEKKTPTRPSTALIIPSDLEVIGPLVSNEPEIRTHDIGPSDQFVLLACDGVYDVMSNLDAVQFVHRRFTEGADAKEACEDLVDEALCRGSADNVTALVVRLKHRPQEEGAGSGGPSPPILRVNLMPQLGGTGGPADAEETVENRGRVRSEPSGR
jgi:serine/threonine protein phosphatase PrpC